MTMLRSTLAAVAAVGVITAGALGAATPAQALTVSQSCTIRLPTGPVHVYATWFTTGRHLQVGSVAIVVPARSGPVRVWTDRVTDRAQVRRLRGGYLSPGATLATRVPTVRVGARTTVAVKGTFGAVRGCTPS